MTVREPGTWRFANKSAVVLLALLAAACSDNNQNPDQAGGPPPANIPAVEAVEARLGSLPLEERLTGRVTAQNQTEIFPEVSGPITSIFVENGDRVEAGEPLAQLRDAEYEQRYQQAVAGHEIAQAQTSQAEADLQLLQGQLRRTQELINRDMESAQNLENIQSQVAIAEANLSLRRAQERQAASVEEERRLQLVNTTIRAPIDGTVGQRNAEVGQLANTGTRLFVLGDLSQMQVEILLGQRMLNYITEGMPVSLYSDSWPDTTLEASITRISPFLDPVTMRTPAHVEMNNPDGIMRPGMFLTADIFYGQSEQAVLIPNSALYRHPRTGLEGVYVVEAPGEELSPLVESDSAGAISPPRSVSFKQVDVVASGRMASGVRGISEGDWVVAIGQNLLEGNVSEARTRLMSWDRIMELQNLQSRDLFEVIERQRQTANDNS